MSGLTDQDARALTFLACRIRKETRGAREWDEAGTFAEVFKLKGQNLVIAVERVTRHAADVEAKTPGAIRRPFIPDAQKSEAPRPPKPNECCRTCGRAMHARDVVCDEPTKRPTAPTADVSKRIEALRAIGRTEETA